MNDLTLDDFFSPQSIISNNNINAYKSFFMNVIF